MYMNSSTGIPFCIGLCLRISDIFISLKHKVSNKRKTSDGINIKDAAPSVAKIAHYNKLYSDSKCWQYHMINDNSCLISHPTVRTDDQSWKNSMAHILLETSFLTIIPHTHEYAHNLWTFFLNYKHPLKYYLTIELRCVD